MNETYHSLKGSMGESQHVFIENGLNYLMGENVDNKIGVLEIGMGTGLNVLLTCLNKGERSVDYQTLEPFPLGKDIWTNLNYPEKETAPLFRRIHEGPWEKMFKLDAQFQLSKYRSKLEDWTSDRLVDIIYFDAFAPSKQPEMWSVANLEICLDSLASGGIMVTYCASGQFKRNLRSLNFEIQVLPGALGKKEMVRAIKP